MESTRTKVEVMKPVLLQAGIPLAISVAGFIIARLTRRKWLFSRILHSENQGFDPLPIHPREEFIDEESFHSLDSMCLPCINDEEQHIVTEEEISGLRCRIERLQERQWQLETLFLQYCKVKETESVLLELQNKLGLEMACVEFMGREVSSMEAEDRRFEDLAVECLRLLEQLEFARLGNGLLHRKVKKISRKVQGLSCVVREQKVKIEAREAEVSRYGIELERKANEVKALEDQIAELQTVIGPLQKEKKELLHKLELAENSDSSKIEAEGISLDDYNQLVNEVKQLQKDRAAEAKELIVLRWCNACLRHELMRRNQERQEQTEEGNNHLELDFEGSGEIEHFGLENEPDGSALGRCEFCSGGTTGAHAHSKRPRKLIQKLKKWVEGSEKMKQKLDER